MDSDTRKAMGFFALIVAIWAISGVVLYCLPERGTFGDMFGAINALFSGCAFAGVIYALILQRHTLELQRTELAKAAEDSELSRATHRALLSSLSDQATAMQQSYRLQALVSALGAADALIAASESRVDKENSQERILLQQQRNKLKSQLLDFIGSASKTN